MDYNNIYIYIYDTFCWKHKFDCRLGRKSPVVISDTLVTWIVVNINVFAIILFKVNLCHSPCFIMVAIQMFLN